MSLVLGCIADDVTGATDLGSALAGGGMRVVQVIGVPAGDLDLPEADALVVALKTRASEPEQAVRQSLAALDWLDERGAERFFFKYSSTFDSTEKGNIGPVIDALLGKLGAPVTIACPAFPDNGRTLYQGHLFVGDRLLSESGMKDHPLNPMTDPNLVRFLRAQTTRRVGLLPHQVIRQGPEAIRRGLRQLQDNHHSVALVDTLSNGDLEAIAAACVDLRLLTGGSGIAGFLPAVFRQCGLFSPPDAGFAEPVVRGFAAVLAGSCSTMTLRQVQHMKQRCPAVALDMEKVAAGDDLVGDTIAWAKQHIGRGPVLIYSSAPPSEVARLQQRLGRAAAGEAVERIHGRIAVELIRCGLRRLVVAGGETAGAVMAALGVKALSIGRPIAPGVPWTQTLGEPGIALALKSGNFGDEDFFLKAIQMQR